jgi:hypothetical protein
MEEVTVVTSIASGNPLNIGIIAAGVLIAIGMVLLFMSKTRVKTKWFSTNGKADLSSAIPRIDRRRDAELVKYVGDAKEVITSSLPASVPRVIRLLLAQKIRSPLYYRIQHNSLTRRFSTAQGIKEWVDLVKWDSKNNVNYIIDYCDLNMDSSEVAYLQSPEFNEFLNKFYLDVVDRFVGIISDYCYEKMDVYKRSGDKELYEKNERYIANMRNAIHP